MSSARTSSRRLSCPRRASGRRSTLPTFSASRCHGYTSAPRPPRTIPSRASPGLAGCASTHRRRPSKPGCGGRASGRFALTEAVAMNRVAAEIERGPKEGRPFLMTRKRKSYQRGNVALHFGVWTLRYRELDHRRGKWLSKRERLGKFKNKTAARRAAEPIMARVNEHNNSDKPPEALHLTFRWFVA